MKKTLILFLLLVTMVSTGCSGNNNSGDTSGNKTKYLEDFKFIPMYPDSEKISSTPPKSDGEIGKAVYKLPDKDLASASSKYQEILKKDGWEVTPDKDKLFLDCKKGEHTAAILFSEKDDQPTLEIIAK